MTRHHWFLSSTALLAIFGVAGIAHAASTAGIAYRVSAGDANRRLIFSNNPEEIHADRNACDLADNLEVAGSYCGKSILRITGALGNYRNWWEHSNKTGRNLTYAVRVYNPGPATAKVTIRGSGLTLEGPTRGGQEFVDMFRRYGRTEHSVGAGKSFWVFNSGSAIPPGKYFAGVVDFDVAGAPVIIDNLAFFNQPAPSTLPMGYTRRVLGPVHESLVYKGLSPHSEAVAEGVDFVIDDDDEPGRLNISHPRYLLPDPSDTVVGRCAEGREPLCQGERGGFASTPTVTDHWITHIGPVSRNPDISRNRAVFNDLVTLFTPGVPAGCKIESRESADTCFALAPNLQWHYPDLGTWEYPNWGNWAVHYKLRGTIVNQGRRTRTIHLGLRASGSSPIAYRGQDGIWLQYALKRADPENPNDYFPYSLIEIPPGQSVPYHGDVILSGPASGEIQNLVRLVQ